MSNVDFDTATAVGNERAKVTLRQIKSYRQISNAALARALGMSTSTVQDYVGGNAKLTAGHLEAFGQVLNVPASVLAMEPAEALGWTVENRPNGGDSIARMNERRRYRKTAHKQVFSRKGCIGDDFPHMGDIGGARVVQLHQVRRGERAIAKQLAAA